MSPEDAIAAIEAIEAEPGFQTHGQQSGDAKGLIMALPGAAFLPPIAMTVERVGDREVAVTLADLSIGIQRRSLRFLAHGYSGFWIEAKPDPETMPEDARDATGFMLGTEDSAACLEILVRWVQED